MVKTDKYLNDMITGMLEEGKHLHPRRGARESLILTLRLHIKL
jgi:hypothetical protein